jgi:hypothetical protein
MRGCWVLVACSDKRHSALLLTFPNSPEDKPSICDMDTMDRKERDSQSRMHLLKRSTGHQYCLLKPPASFWRKPESRFYAVFWTPAFAGVTSSQQHCREAWGDGLIHRLSQNSFRGTQCRSC